MKTIHTPAEAGEKVASQVRETTELLKELRKELSEQGYDTSIDGTKVRVIGHGFSDYFLLSLSMNAQEKISCVTARVENHIDERNNRIDTDAFLGAVAEEISPLVVDVAEVEQVPAKCPPTEEEEIAARVASIEKKIADRELAVELATGLELEIQHENHTEKLQLLKKQKLIAAAGYEGIYWDDKLHGETIPLENFGRTISLEGLYALKNAKDSGLFDEYAVWTIWNDDSVLIGRVVVAGRKACYEIICW